MTEQDMRDRIESELMTGEKILWVGQSRGLRRDVLSIASVGFTILWLLFALSFVGIFMFAGDTPEAVVEPASTVDPEVPHIAFIVLMSMFLIIPLLFILGGVWGVFKSIWVVVSPKWQTYAVTSQRGIIRTDGLQKNTVSLLPGAFNKIIRTGNSESGNLVFENLSLMNRVEAMSFRRLPVEFYNINTPKAVEDLILKTFRGETTT